jgi:hypothetical protein
VPSITKLRAAALFRFTVGFAIFRLLQQSNHVADKPQGSPRQMMLEPEFIIAKSD